MSLEIEPGAVLVADPSRATADELARCGLLAIRLVSAAQRGDLVTIWQLTPRSVDDLQYLLTAMTDLVTGVIEVAGLDPADVIDELRSRAISRHRERRDRQASS